MNTQTATATKQAPLEKLAEGEKGGEIAVFQPPRMPYHPLLKDRFNIEPSAWKSLVEAIYPTAKSIDFVILALSYCKARNLDPFKKPVHIVPMWDSRANNGQGGYVETIWPGISEVRTTAFRTGNYAGSDEAEFGPMVDKTFSGRVRKGREWETKNITVRFPEWCRVTVYRDLHGLVCKFVGPKVVWLEAYATIGKSDLPNDMWQTRPEGQLEKCAEAAALRKAFPEELGNELTAEEMAGRHIRYDDRVAQGRVVKVTPTADADGPPDPNAVKGGPQTASQPAQAESQPQAEPEPEQSDIIEGEFEEAEPLPEGANEQAKLTPKEEQDWLNQVNGAFSGCEDLETFGKKQSEVMAPYKRKVSPAIWTKAQVYAEETFRRVSDKG